MAFHKFKISQSFWKWACCDPEFIQTLTARAVTFPGFNWIWTQVHKMVYPALYPTILRTISLGSPWLLTQTCHHPWLASSQTTLLMDCSFLGSFIGDWSTAAHTWGETRISSFLLHMTCNGWWVSSDGEQVWTAGRQRAWITISKLDGLSTQDSSYLSQNVSQNVHIPNVTGLHFRSPQWGKVYVSLYTRNLGQRVTNRVTNAGQRTNLEDSLKRRCELVFDGYLVGW